MAKKKELDNLSKDMIRCKADGFGCHYGQWKVSNWNTKDRVEEITPQGWLICKYCGKPFKPRTKRKQLYCEAVCQSQAQREKRKEYYRNYSKAWRERNADNESYA